MNYCGADLSFAVFLRCMRLMAGQKLFICLLLFTVSFCTKSDKPDIFASEHTNNVVFACVCWCPRGESVGLHWLILSGKDYIRDYLEPSNMGQWHSCVKHTKTQETYPYWLQQNIFSKVKFLQF